MTSEIKEKVCSYFNRHLRKALQVAEFRPDLLRSSIQWILQNRLHLFPYIIDIVEELERIVCNGRIEFDDLFQKNFYQNHPI